MTYREALSTILKGNLSAISFIETVFSIAHFWDDLIDKDRAVSDADINRAMWQALVELPQNAFYLQNFDALHPVLVNAIANWHAATAFEREKDTNERHLQIAFIARSDYCNLLIQSAYLIGGWDWMLAMAPAIRDVWTKEDMVKYTENLAAEKQQREGETHGLLQQ